MVWCGVVWICDTSELGGVFFFSSTFFLFLNKGGGEGEEKGVDEYV